MEKKILLLLLPLFLLNNGNILYAQDTVCYGASDTLSISNSNSSYRYRWLNRTLSSFIWDTAYSWGNRTSYIIPNITTSKVVICQCDTNSDGLPDTTVLNKTIIALGELLPGTIGNDGTVCYGQSPSQLSLLANATGGGSSYSYFWQQSSNNTTFTTIFGEYNTTFSPTGLISDKYYRMGFRSIAGCGVVYSNSVHIGVLPPSQPATIASSNNTPICNNTAPDSLYIDVPPQGGDGNFSFQWQYYSLGIWHNVPGATNRTFHPSALSQTTQYRLATTNTCGTDYSSIPQACHTTRPLRLRE